MRLRWFRRPTLAARVPLPHPLSWAAGSVVLLAAAGAVVTEGLPDVGWLGLRLAVTDDGPRNVIAAALGVLAVFTTRRFLYSRLARRAGRVEITSFTGDPPKRSGVTRADVLAEFGRALGEMSLSAPEPVPNEPSARSIVDDVRTAFDGNRTAFVTALLLVVSLLRVRHAYRVSVEVLSSGTRRCGLSVHVARMPAGRSEVETVWADDWLEAAERAAHVVGAYLVPRSRLSRRAPWLAWHGVQMPSELFHQSQRAARFTRERRYEQALDALHLALEEDPQNPFLRIELGQVQEQTGLHLDAAATYADIIAVESWYDGRLWRRLRRLLGDSTTGAPPATLIGRRNGRDALLIARYRVVARLGSAEQLYDQWTRPAAKRNGRRRADREALKARLRIWLNSYALEYERADPWVPRPERTTVPYDRVAAYEDAPRARFVHLIRTVGRHEAESLADDYRWSRGRRVPGLAINQTAVQLLRLAAVLLEKRSRSELGLPGTDGWWPADPDRLDIRIGRRLYLKPGIARSWKEYYNAACVAALALPGTVGRDGHVDLRSRTELALQAVRHLERAVSTTDSGYVGRYAQWLSTGDQDLNALRSTHEFVDFLDRYLPNSEPRVPRPESELLKLVMSFHTLHLLTQFCERRVEFWERYASGEVPAAVARSELDLEPWTTALVGEYVSHDRHWQTRMKLIEAASDFCRRAGLLPIDDAFPRFQEDPKVIALADDPIALAEAARAPDAYFRSMVIDVREKALDDLLDVVAGRTFPSSSSGVSADVATAAPRCRAFWRRVGRAGRAALGLDERAHRSRSVSVYTDVVSPVDDGPAAGIAPNAHSI